MLDGRNDVSLVNETKTEKVIHAPCIKRLMGEGTSGSYRVEMMTEVAKSFYRQEIDKAIALPVIIACNSRNMPPLPEQEIHGIVYSVYTTGVATIDCDKRFLKKHCNKDECRLNGSPVMVVPTPVKASAPIPVAVVSEPLKPSVSFAVTVMSEPAKAGAPSLVKPYRHVLTIDYLPKGWLREYIEFAEPLTEASLQYHLATALAIAATVLGRKVYLCAGASIYYPNLYIVVLGPSGMARKSTAIGICDWFLPEVNPDYILSGNVMSVEGLLEAFRTSSTHIVVYDELKNLAVNASKPYGRGLISTYTSLWTCPKSLRIDVKKIPPNQRQIFEPTLNILAATTMEWLDLKEGDLLGGFWGRFLPIYSDKNGQRRLPIRPPADKAQKERLIGWLRAMNARPDSQYVWQPDAQRYYIDTYNSLRDAFDKESNKPYLEPYWSRIADHIIKLAMIFDACSFNPTFAITKDNLERAKAIMDIITGYYREMLGQATFSRPEKKERQFMDILERAYPEAVGHSAIMRSLHLEAGPMKRIVDSLVEKELIEIDEVITAGAKKPKRRYRLRGNKCT